MVTGPIENTLNSGEIRKNTVLFEMIIIIDFSVLNTHPQISFRY